MTGSRAEPGLQDVFCTGEFLLLSSGQQQASGRRFIPDKQGCGPDHLQREKKDGKHQELSQKALRRFRLEPFHSPPFPNPRPFG